ncbi:MAG TPA: DUF3037 domain-containing protein [Bacteroidia bacterium]|jgi:hypothetical protein|nr:DUF3037 domain-containing protein [Bacteroidia bacterium]
MHEKYLYEYAIIRVLPFVEREEFINVGIILFCKEEKYIQVLFALNEAKLRSFSKDLDLDQIRLNLQSFEKIAMGTENCGPIGQLDVPSRFRWLTSIRSTVIQTSRPHPGLCNDLEQTAKRLFDELVS